MEQQKTMALVESKRNNWTSKVPCMAVKKLATVRRMPKESRGGIIYYQLTALFYQVGVLESD